MKNIRLAYYLSLAFFAILFPLEGAQTIAEKKAGLNQKNNDLTPEMQKFLTQINQEVEACQKGLQHTYGEVLALYQQHASSDAFRDLLQKINGEKANIYSLETQWRELAMQNQEEEYALWHQPNTSLDQLVIDYGSQDYVYLIPPEMAEMPLSINSNLPIPRACWDRMLEMILAQNGIGVRQLNPYLRQLYFVQEDHSGLSLITNKRQDLDVLPSNERIAFMLTPEPSDVRRIWSFLEKFINPHSTVLQLLGRDILVIAQVSEVLELLKLYDFAVANRGDKEYKVASLHRVDAEEMARILAAIFGQMQDSITEEAVGSKRKRGGASSSNEDNGLKIIPLAQVAQAVFLIGTREEICKAERIICDVESQVGEARERVIYWYTAKNSNPEELAEVLSKIYALMIETNVGAEKQGESETGQTNIATQGIDITTPPPVVEPSYSQGYYLDDNVLFNKAPPPDPSPANQDRDNFIVDPKTGAIVMVVEADILPKLRQLLKKLDVPKKMVQIEVLLFEKKLSERNNFGLNLLRIGCKADDINGTGATFNDSCDNPVEGIFEFLISRSKSSGIPAFDLVYKFLLSQEDVQINASPSVLAINQTPATIEIAEEISVNTGFVELGNDNRSNVKNSYARAQYGIKIGITPTIHVRKNEDGFCDDDECDFVTLATDITFQTFKPHPKDRPDVVTRHITNEVCIPDGQTIIIGGLRQKTSIDKTERVPFLGEIPGLGKLFSINEMQDNTTEMFIFLTPKIVTDPCHDLERIRAQEMCRRPGDIPEFLCTLLEAQEWEKKRLLHGTMKILFGRQPDRCVAPQGEYDGK